MSEPVVLYYNPMSRARIAHWMLEEVGVPYRLELLRLDRAEHKQPAYLKINPMGKVPTLVDHGVVITECGAICAFLADNYPRAQLAPALHDPERGTYLRWLFFGAGCVEPAMLDKSFPRAGDVPASSLGYGSYDDVVRTLDLALTTGPYLLGERFSAADVYLASQIGWGLMTKALAPRGSFTRYLARMEERPAYKRFTAQSTELARQLKGA